MKTDIQGVSQTQPGQEQWEEFTTRGLYPKKMIQYDYRTPAGQLFSCVAPSLDHARHRRDAWLTRQIQ